MNLRKVSRRYRTDCANCCVVLGRLLLDQQKPAVFRMVCQFVIAVGNRASGTGWSHGAFPGDAHVHYECPAEDRHEGGRSSAGLGLAPRESKILV